MLDILFTWNVYGLPKVTCISFVCREKKEFSVPVPLSLFGSLFSGAYRPLVYMCKICVTLCVFMCEHACMCVCVDSN